MAGVFEYLKWRGDILFSELPPNPVDALIFSTLAYIYYDGIVPEEPYRWILLSQVAEKLLALPEGEGRSRVKKDIELLKAAAATPRFGRAGMSFYKNVLLPKEETQFSAVTFFLEDGSAFLAFRGTDNTLTGWREDFNMSFQESVPAQRMALAYLQEFYEYSEGPLRLGGHSKGGNLAVYAAVKSGRALQEGIVEVYNHDGPGFTNNLMGDSDYLNLVPKIRTYIPQSSVVGMLLEHEEPYQVIKSKQIGVMQHDPYSWEVLGKDFIYLETVTAESQLLDRAIKSWLATLSDEERNKIVDTVFELLSTGDVEHVSEIIQPKNLVNYIKTLGANEESRRFLAGEIANVVRLAEKKVKKLKEKAEEKQLSLKEALPKLGLEKWTSERKRTEEQKIERIENKEENKEENKKENKKEDKEEIQEEEQ